MRLSRFAASLVLLTLGAVGGLAAPAPAPKSAAPPADPPAPKWVPGYAVRFPLRPVAVLPGDKLQTESVIARLPAAGWLRADGSDVCVQAPNGELMPVSIVSHNPAGDTLIQFKRQADAPLYWAYGANPTAPAASAPPFAEGLSVEFRDWAGDSLANWADVVAGLKKSTNVTANAFVDMVAQNVNPGQPGNHRNFAASYRGFLRVPETARYKFYVGAENAAFLFIDGNRVFEQKGSHRFTIRFPASDWVELELAAGVHPLELHHVCGSDALVATCALYYRNDHAKKKVGANYVPAEMFARATLAEVIGIEGENGAPAATFAWGVDDTLSTPGINLHLARFEAQGTLANPAQIEWDFGDGTKGKGPSPLHVYFKPGEYLVTMNAGAGQRPIKQRVYMWTAPSPTSPFSLEKAVALLSSSEWAGWDTQRVNSLFDFLIVSEQPNRWPLIEKIGRHLLGQPDVDLKRRVMLQTMLMEALAEQGRGAEAMKLAEEALAAAGKLPSLRVAVLLKGADLRWMFLKEYTEASQLYEKIVTEHRALDTPAVREAAIHWGDLFMQAGDMRQAEERYRLAKTLGGERFAATGQTEAIQRGAQLRIAEQRLRSGDVRGTRLLLQRMELDFPEQKLEGMYRFLRAETDRFAGRYDEAIGHYEVLLKLRQWAGFRDRAIHGLADCYFRQENFVKAREWFDRLRESFPEYMETKKLGSVYTLVQARAEGARADRSGGVFRGFTTGFEPGQPEGAAVRITFERMLGIDGPQVGFVRNGGSFVYTKELQNLPPGGDCWVEFWYREQMQSREVTAWGNATVAMFPGAENATKTQSDTFSVPLQRTYGQWRKAAGRLRVPPAQDGTVKLTFVNAFGSLKIDGLKILPVSDRQADSLRSFIEAAEIE